MNKVIWKYELEVTEHQTVYLPLSAKILTVQAQRHVPNLWAIVDPLEKDTVKRHIEMFGTGHLINEDIVGERIHLGTFQLDDGNLVFHVFGRSDFYRL